MARSFKPCNGPDSMIPPQIKFIFVRLLLVGNLNIKYSITYEQWESFVSTGIKTVGAFTSTLL